VTYSALIKLGRIVTADVMPKIIAGEQPADQFYATGALRLMPGTVPVVVDHEMHRSVGQVIELFEADDTDGRWVWARTAVTDRPAWLSRGTRCSFGRYNAHVSQFGWTHRAFVQEVSLLRDLVPKEPRAHVATLYRSDEPVIERDDPVVEVFYGGDVIRRPNSGYVTGWSV
jgi:hypothetical protein